MPGFMSLAKELMEWAFEPLEKTIKEAEEKLAKEQKLQKPPEEKLVKQQKPQALRRLKWKD